MVTRLKFDSNSTLPIQPKPSKFVGCHQRIRSTIFNPRTMVKPILLPSSSSAFSFSFFTARRVSLGLSSVQRAHDSSSVHISLHSLHSKSNGIIEYLLLKKHITRFKTVYHAFILPPYMSRGFYGGGCQLRFDQSSSREELYWTIRCECTTKLDKTSSLTDWYS